MTSLRFLSWDTNMADGKVARKQSHVSENTLLTIRHCARLFLFLFSRERGNHCFFDRAHGREFLSSIASAAVEIRLENLWHGNLNISELSTENGVAVVNTHGSILGDNEDHVGLLIFLRHRAGKFSPFGFDFEIKS